MSVVRWQNTDMLYVCLTWIRILMIHMLHRWAEQLILMPFMVIYVTIKSSISLQTIMLSFTELSWCNHRQYQSGRFNMNSFTFSLERKCKNTGWNECSCLPCLQQRGSRSREPCSTPDATGRRGGLVSQHGVGGEEIAPVCGAEAGAPGGSAVPTGSARQ